MPADNHEEFRRNKFVNAVIFLQDDRGKLDCYSNLIFQGTNYWQPYMFPYARGYRLLTAPDFFGRPKLFKLFDVPP